MTRPFLRTASVLGVAALLFALVATLPAGAREHGRAVGRLSDHFEITAQAFDGSGTLGDPADVHEDEVDQFHHQVGATDDSPVGETRTATSTTRQDSDVSEIGSGVGMTVETSGAADAESDDDDIQDGDTPFARGDSELRITIDVTGDEVGFSLSGSASASSTGISLDGRGGTPCSQVNIGVPDGTIATVVTPSRCGSPASSQLKITGTLAPGQHEFTVSAVAQAVSATARHAHAQVQFDLTLMVAACDIVGTPQGERIDGTGDGEVICGMGGADTILAGGGNYTIFGGRQADTVLGGAGDDTITTF